MSQSTQNTPSQPTLCKMGCGFFGSNATGDCCSKCWKDAQATQKKEENVMGAASSEANTSAVPMETSVAPVQPETAPMEIDNVAVTAPATAPASPAASEEKASSPVAETPTKKKKKKKKGGYKNMMATMMEAGQTRDTGKDKEALRNNVGGGAFSKIDKI